MLAFDGSSSPTRRRSSSTWSASSPAAALSQRPGAAHRAPLFVDWFNRVWKRPAEPDRREEEEKAEPDRRIGGALDGDRRWARPAFELSAAVSSSSATVPAADRRVPVPQVRACSGSDKGDPDRFQRGAARARSAWTAATRGWRPGSGGIDALPRAELARPERAFRVSVPDSTVRVCGTRSGSRVSAPS